MDLISLFIDAQMPSRPTTMATNG